MPHEDLVFYNAAYFFKYICELHVVLLYFNETQLVENATIMHVPLLNSRTLKPVLRGNKLCSLALGYVWKSEGEEESRCIEFNN